MPKFNDHRYRILDPDNPLRGGFAEVYEAIEVELNRPVAIKFPKEGLMTPESKKAFSLEAERTATLIHTNIVEVYGSGLTEDPPYLILEWVPNSLK